MKKLIILVVSLLSLFSFTGCDWFTELGSSIEALFSDLPGQTEIRGHTITWADGFETKPEHIHLWWEWAENTDGHILERKAPSDENEGFQQIMYAESSEFWDIGDKLRDQELISGDTYVYRVCGYNENGEGEWSAEYTVVIPLQP